LRILLADDDPAFSQLVAEWLRGKGFEVQVTPDAVTTLVAAVARPPDLILLDVRMPGGSGLDTLRKLKLLPKTREVPVIVASAVVSPSFAGEAEAIGAARFIPKPVRLNELLAAIRDELGLTED
jgi:CheY-like chemotaxis protein